MFELDYKQVLTVPVRYMNVETVSESKRLAGYSRRHRTHATFNLLCILLLLLSTGAAAFPGALMCHHKMKCFNGGKLLVSNVAFGGCFCVCKKQYVGIQCEFSKRIRRVNRLKSLVKIKNDVGLSLFNKKANRWRYWAKLIWKPLGNVEHRFLITQICGRATMNLNKEISNLRNSKKCKRGVDFKHWSLIHADVLGTSPALEYLQDCFL